MMSRKPIRPEQIPSVPQPNERIGSSTKRLIKNTILRASLAALAMLAFSELSEATEPQNSLETNASLLQPSEIDNGLACQKPSSRSIERFEPLGPLYEIVEPNLLELFMNRIKSMKEEGTYDQRFSENKEEVRNLLENPLPVEGLGKSASERVWLLTASIPESLPDQLLRQAQEIELPRISRELLFIDGTDPLSIESAKALSSRFPDMRIVLTAGSPSEVSKALDKRIFFDQGGGLVRVFGIEAVPAILFNSPNGPTGLEFPVTETEEILQKYFPVQPEKAK